MPGRSRAQINLFRACMHGAGYSKCPRGMNKNQMREFASTPTSGLPQRVSKKRRMSKRSR